MTRSMTTKEAAPPSPPKPAAPAPKSIVPKPSSRHRDETDQLKLKLLQAQKLANLGTMVGMLAHECNNLLTPILTYGRFALDANDPALLRKGMEITLRQGAVLMKMSDRLLGAMARQAPVYRAVELRGVMDLAVDSLCRDLAKDGISLHNQIPAGMEVFGDPEALQQLFFNLLLNSRRALLNRRGKLTVTAALVESGWVRIQFRDTGCGISQDRLPHIFEAFTTSKFSEGDEPRKAAGLGLAICKMIVEDHHGTISVESEVNLGTTFIIDLPSAASQQAAIPVEKPKRARKLLTSRT